MLKAAMIISYAGAPLGDNGDFIAVASQIRAGTDWLFNAQTESSAVPPTLWRPIGYPLVIAAVQQVFGANWVAGLCTFQSVLSLAAGILLIRLCLAAGLRLEIALLVFLLHQWSVPLSTDVLVMEDALTGALGLCAFSTLLVPLAKNEIPATSAFATAGWLFAVSFLIRDVYHFVVPIIGLGTLAALLASGTPRRRAFLSVALLVAPVFVFAAALQSWNEYRTGHRVITTAGQTAYLYAVLRAAEHDPSVIGGPTKVEEILRETNRTFDYVDTRAANEALFRREGMDAIAQFEAARSLFWQTLASHPMAYAKAAFKRLRFLQQATLFWGPLTRLDDLHWWAGGATEEGYRTGWRADALAFFQSRNWRDLTPEIFTHLALRKGSQLVGLAIFIVFLVGTPLTWLFLRYRSPGPINAAIAAWLIYGLWVSLYLLVSFEARYLSPVIGPALFATAITAVNGSLLLRSMRQYWLNGRLARKP